MAPFSRVIASADPQIDIVDVKGRNVWKEINNQRLQLLIRHSASSRVPSKIYLQITGGPEELTQISYLICTEHIQKTEAWKEGKFTCTQSLYLSPLSYFTR